MTISPWASRMPTTAEPIEAIHGGPVRTVVPHLYFWKVPSGCVGWSYEIATSPASGSATATTYTATRSSNSDNGAIELYRSDRPLDAVEDGARLADVLGALREVVRGQLETDRVERGRSGLAIVHCGVVVINRTLHRHVEFR